MVSRRNSSDPPTPMQASWLTLFAHGNAGRSLLLAGGVAVHAVSVFVVATILPSVVADIGGLSFYAWTTMLFVTGSITGSAVVPSMLGHLGSRVSYRVALGLFALGSIVCAMAPDMVVLLAGRLVQGFGGGLLPALAYATIRRLFPEPLWPRAISMVSGVWGVAALTGPLVGGVFAELDAWRWAFLVDVPIAAIFAIVADRVLPRGDATQSSRPVPVLRLLCFVAAVVALASSGVTRGGWTAAVGIFASLSLFIALLRLDRTADHPLLPTDAYNPRAVIGASSATMALLALCTSTTPFVPYLLHKGQALGPMGAGYVSALQALSWTVAALLTASANAAVAARLILLGPAVMAIGIAVMAWALTAGSLLPVVLAQMLIGAGIGMGWAHLGATMMSAALPSERDIASAFISTTQLVSVALGSAIAGIVVNAAGLTEATTPGEVLSAGSWLYGSFFAAPCAAVILSHRLLTLMRRLP